MPPYGLYSLANTPEELLNRGYGYTGDIPYNRLSDEEQNLMRTKYDRAFGNLNTQMGYFSAPYTGGIPFQNVSFLKDDGPFGLGYDGDLYNPSFGGASNINYDQYEPEGILPQVDSKFPLYDEFTVAEEGDDLKDNAVTVDESGNLKQPSGFKDFLKAMLGFSPVGMLQNLFNTSGPNYQRYSPGARIRNGIVSIDGVNTPYNAFGGDFFNPDTGLNRFDRAALRGDIFGSSRTLKEYLDKKRQISDARKIANRPGENNPDGSGGYTGGFDTSTGNYNDPYSPGDTE